MRNLWTTLEAELPLLRAITDARAAVRPGPGKWSKKEELGHLIDSASNNHQRFVRAALEGKYEGPRYDQEAWVVLHGYEKMPFDAILELWHRYNLLLARLVDRIPAARLEAPCVVGDGEAVMLRFLIEDYVLHMQHHLDHILDRETITVYPRG